MSVIPTVSTAVRAARESVSEPLLSGLESLPAPLPEPVARLLDVRTIYVEPAAADHPRGRQILDRFPDAERIPVESHMRIPGLFGNEGNVAR